MLNKGFACLAVVALSLLVGCHPAMSEDDSFYRRAVATPPFRSSDVVTLLDDADVPPGKTAYITTATILVNGSQDWDTGGLYVWIHENGPRGWTMLSIEKAKLKAGTFHAYPDGDGDGFFWRYPGEIKTIHGLGAEPGYGFSFGPDTTISGSPLEIVISGVFEDVNYTP